jgi:hypothetical protein
MFLSDRLESSGQCQFQDWHCLFAGLRRLRFSFFSDEPTQSMRRWSILLPATGFGSWEVQIFPGPPFPAFAGVPQCGAIAQLGERLLCKQEVVGSIPSGSTSGDPDCQNSFDCNTRP